MTRPIIIRSGGPEPGRAGIRDTWPARPVRRGAQLQFDPGFVKARSLVACTLIHLHQESLSRCAVVFHFLSLSAGRAGLVRVFDRHEHTERKIGNDGRSFGEIQNVYQR